MGKEENRIFLPLNMTPQPSEQFKYTGVFSVGTNTSLSFIPLNNLQFTYQPTTGTLPLTHSSPLDSVLTEQPIITLFNGIPQADQGMYQNYVDQLRAQKAFTFKNASEYSVLQYKLLANRFFPIQGYVNLTIIKGQSVLSNIQTGSFRTSKGVVMSLLQVKHDYNIWPDIFSNSESQESKFYVMEAKEGSSGDISVSNVIIVVQYQAKKVLATLAEVSGLLILLKILTVVFSFIHEYLFNKEMRDQEEIGERNYKEVFTYTNFKKALRDIEILKENFTSLNVKYQELQEQNMVMQYQLRQVRKIHKD
ncbi:hypothetical protein FGO68_gene5147 [Halteria grandinella]|uniref:Uncharacterized protein n=1 Tax=Halteria grandinella TaxID=5974 RepID=A0A8J8T3T9_HALGN|nr:hypothetical protein FGO68_gene5147 [Halteria grandinella]